MKKDTWIMPVILAFFTSAVEVSITPMNVVAETPVPEFTVTPVPSVTAPLVLEENYISITKKLLNKRCKGRRASVIKRRFKEAGFKDIHFIKVETSNIEDDKSVLKVSINGFSDYAVDDIFYYNAMVEITYFTYKEGATHSDDITQETALASTPAPIWTPTPVPTPTSVSEYADYDTVRTIQEDLNILGYNCGTPDGKLGDMTRNAISAFQSDHGITVNGLLSGEFIEAVNLVVNEYNENQAKAQATSKFEYAYEYHPSADNTKWIMIDVDERIIVEFDTYEKSRIISSYTGDLNSGISWPDNDPYFYGKWTYTSDSSNLSYGTLSLLDNLYQFKQIDVIDAENNCSIYTDHAIDFDGNEVIDDYIYGSR